MRARVMQALTSARVDHCGLSMTRRFLFPIGSSLPGGYTGQLARRAAPQLPADTDQR